MRKFAYFLSVLMLLIFSITSFGFKEVPLNRGVEVGFGWVYKGAGFDIGYEGKLNDKVDIYPWVVIGGIGSDFGFGAQIDFPIKVFSQDIFGISVSPFGGVDFVFVKNKDVTTLNFDFDLGGYGLFSFDFRKEGVPISFSLGFGPNISFSANPSFEVFYTVNISVYLDGVTLQLGGNSKFAGISVKIGI
jgi:hypothetical protein